MKMNNGKNLSCKIIEGPSCSARLVQAARVVWHLQVRTAFCPVANYQKLYMRCSTTDLKRH